MSGTWERPNVHKAIHHISTNYVPLPGFCTCNNTMCYYTKHWKNYPFSYQQKTKVGSKYELHFMDISGARIFHPLTSSPPDSNLPQRTYRHPRQLQSPITLTPDNFNPQDNFIPRQLQLQTTSTPLKVQSEITGNEFAICGDVVSYMVPTLCTSMIGIC